MPGRKSGFGKRPTSGAGQKNLKKHTKLAELGLSYCSPVDTIIGRGGEVRANLSDSPSSACFYRHNGEVQDWVTCHGACVSPSISGRRTLLFTVVACRFTLKRLRVSADYWRSRKPQHQHLLLSRDSGSHKRQDLFSGTSRRVEAADRWQSRSRLLKGNQRWRCMIVTD